jgi:hypothetical protein
MTAATALPRNPGRSLTATTMRRNGRYAETSWRPTLASLLVVAQQAGSRVEELLTRRAAGPNLYLDRSSIYRITLKPLAAVEE